MMKDLPPRIERSSLLRLAHLFIKWLGSSLLLWMVSFSVFALHDTYHLFDYQNCQRFTIANDPLDGSNYSKIQQRIKELGLNTQWSPFHSEDGKGVGICRTTFNRTGQKTRIDCKTEHLGEFPLAGSTFVASGRFDLQNFRCAVSCRSKNLVLSDEGYESEAENVELKMAENRFNRQCKSRAR